MDLMIDLETLDTAPSAVIVSVGICAFDNDGIHDKKYYNLCADEQVRKGRTMSFDTLEWWFRQEKAVIDAAFNIPTDKKTPIKEFLRQFGFFCSKHHIQKVWAQGMDFDLSMISDLHRQYDVELPYQYFLGRDARTFCEGMKKPERIGTHHNAMDDAVYQAECVILQRKKIK
jgi:hypothetical protein